MARTRAVSFSNRVYSNVEVCDGYVASDKCAYKSQFKTSIVIGWLLVKFWLHEITTCYQRERFEADRAAAVEMQKLWVSASSGIRLQSR